MTFRLQLPGARDCYEQIKSPQYVIVNMAHFTGEGTSTSPKGNPGALNVIHPARLRYRYSVLNSNVSGNLVFATV